MPNASICKPVSSGPPAAWQMFMTLRLPDCAKGQVELTNYRSNDLHFAAGDGDGRVFLYEKKAWFDALKARAAARRGRAPILYIHGFNNSNDQVVERARKIAWALKDRYPVVALTWPSYGRKTYYFWDEANAEWALEAGSAAVDQITEAFPKTFIVAHSMGSRLALRAAADLHAGKRLHRVERLILAAADVDRGALANAWGRNGPALPVTMYVSRKDQPLSASWRGHAYPRAGDFSWWVSGRQPFYAFAWVPNVEVIDTTDVDQSTLGHSAFIDVPEGALDLCRVIEGFKPDHRGVKPIQGAPTNYFQIAGSGPADICTEENGRRQH